MEQILSYKISIATLFWFVFILVLTKSYNKVSENELTLKHNNFQILYVCFYLTKIISEDLKISINKYLILVKSFNL